MGSTITKTDYEAMTKIQRDINTMLLGDRDLDCLLMQNIVTKVQSLEVTQVRDKLIQCIDDLKREIADIYKDRSRLKSFIEERGADIAKSLNADTIKLHVLQTHINSSTWQKLELLGIKKPVHEGVFIRGGHARTAGKILLGGGAQNLIPQDYETLSDVDLLVNHRNLDHNFLKDFYNADSEGISYLSDTEQGPIGYVDLSCNEVLLSSNHLYYTPAFLETAKSNIATINHFGINLYKINSYLGTHGSVLHASNIGRGIKFLIEGKLKGMRLEKHHLKKENLEVLGFDKEIIVIARRIMKKSDESQRISELYKLGYILSDLKLISDPTKVFEFIKDSQTKHARSVQSTSHRADFDLRRKLTKLNNLLFWQTIGIQTVTAYTLEGYDFSENELYDYCPDLSGKPNNTFIRLYQDFK